MTRSFWCGGVMLLACAVSVNGEGKKEEKEPAVKNAGLERLKKLAGEWVAVDADGKPTAHVITAFKLTAGGSAVQETIHPGKAMEMVSLYHMDGADLVLTHYCALGNQPRMKLDPKSPANKLQFVFAGGSNLNPEKDMHIHEGSITFIDDDHIEWAWQAYMDGKPAKDHMLSVKLVRKK